MSEQNQGGDGHIRLRKILEEEKNKKAELLREQAAKIIKRSATAYGSHTDIQSQRIQLNPKDAYRGPESTQH